MKIGSLDQWPYLGYKFVSSLFFCCLFEPSLILPRSYGVFLSYYLANDVFPGATSTDYALIGGLSIGAAMIVSPLATYTTGRYGTRTTLLIGVFLETLSLIAASFARATWQLFLSQGACFGLGMGFLC